jgi:hypothetical protein
MKTQIRLDNEKDAIEQAQELSAKYPEAYYNVIKSQGYWYVEDFDSLVRVWETLVCTFINGKKLKR